MKLHVLSVGQADAMILELPSGRLAVVDCGHPALLDYLAALDPTRHRRIAFCLLTHAHHDHYAHLEEFIAQYDARVDEYWFSFVQPGAVSALRALFTAAFRRRRGGSKARLLVQDLPAAQPFLLEEQVQLTRFCPSTQELYAPVRADHTAENNRSVVLLLRYGQCTVLLGADAEEARWQRIAAQAGRAALPLAADVIKAPHHGAAAPHGMPADLWPAVCRTPSTFVAFSVGAQGESWPGRGTITALHGQATVRCTGRAAICRPLGPAPAAVKGRARPTSLIARSLTPPPETQAAPPCFGTQVYTFDPCGSITLTTSAHPAFLDACR